MRETVEAIASPQTKAHPARSRGVGTTDFTADGADERSWDAVGCDSSHRVAHDLGWNVLGEYADDSASFWAIGAKERGYVWDGMTALAAIEGANPASGAAADGAGTLLGWDSPRARFGGDGTASGVTEVVSHASQPDGDALAWYSPLGDGSTRGIYGVAGAVLAAVGYSPYGAPGMHNASAAPAFTYTGKPYDTATGLYHFPYRQYDLNAARWLTRDPLGMVDGPNVYAYVMGNPVGAVDPMGLAIEVCVRPLRGAGGGALQSCVFP